MANVNNYQPVLTLLSSGAASLPNTAVVNLTTKPQPDPTSGGTADPVGPQRWPLKL
ncbi:MAG: hypothetical protein ACREPM_21780 [Gemmatimonadaceae bacterium]